MAMLTSATTSSAPKSHVELEAIQTVIPLKVTDPRSTIQIEANGVATSSIFNRRVHVVLYFHKASNEGSGYFVGGWLRDSLGRVLNEEPMLAGRVRRGEREGGFKIVTNDGGVRLIEARISKTLAEFAGVRGSDEVEDELVSWEDVDDGNIEFSSLTCVQVTNFLCGGYSLGVSCSLLVADPFSIIRFLKRWADIHKSTVFRTNSPKLPLFYFPNLKPMDSSIVKRIGSDTLVNHGKSFIFKSSVTKTLNAKEMNKSLALECVKEAELKHCDKRAYSFCLIAKELKGEVKVEKVERGGVMEKPLFLEFSSVNWDDLGAREVSFSKTNKAIWVSSWINCISGEGLAFLFPFSSGSVYEINILVTLPEENEA